MVSVDWFGLTGPWNRPVISEKGTTYAAIQVGSWESLRSLKFRHVGKHFGRKFYLPGLGHDGNA